MSAERMHLEQGDISADAEVNEFGRVNITLSGDTSRLEQLIHSAATDDRSHTQDDNRQQSEVALNSIRQPLNIVIHVVGSRGDVQPFIALGLQLKKYNHRVRLATHFVFKSFVEEQGLEFFCIGGDPAELMAFMVKNPSLIPSISTIRSGEINRRRATMKDILVGCWRSCVEAGDGVSEESQATANSFVADAIIANPPSFAHLHCAERLGVPLHIMFTMPWSPTEAFPHPLANMVDGSADPGLLNFLSYALVETLTWQGLGDLINTFRQDTLGLGVLETSSAPGTLSRLKIPHTYMWSPALIPKPNDWQSHLSVTGFCSLPLASNFSPSEELLAFLNKGPPPVYIGFGSIVVDDPSTLTRIITEAVTKAGVRALVSQGWGGLSVSDSDSKDILVIGNCPHDWLFTKVACVVHHGGAGTTAAGLAAGKPTVVVPFFGDQKFWGEMIARAGAGPWPIPHADLTSEKLAGAISFCTSPSTIQNAAKLQLQISEEEGSVNAAASFVEHLPSDLLPCDLSQGNRAVWKVRKRKVYLGTLAAAVLLSRSLLKESDLKLHKTAVHTTTHGAFDPISGSTIPAAGVLGNILLGFFDIARGTSSLVIKREPGTLPGLQVASMASKGLLRVSKAIAKSPMEMTLGMSQGLHNAPKIYGDQTVRPLGTITGLKSGLTAGGKELGLGIYDGFSGVVTHPMEGKRREGSSGLAKGVAIGLGGLLLKPFAGVSGLFGYTFKGIYEEIRKKHGIAAEAVIRIGRLAEGFTELECVSEVDQIVILEKWEHLSGSKGTMRKKSA